MSTGTKTNNLANYEEARGLVVDLIAAGIPVRKGDDELFPSPAVDEKDRPGIFRPLWIDAGNQPVPQYVDDLGVKYWELDLMVDAGGTSGFNVGMLLQRLRKDPWHKQAVYDEIKRDMKPAGE